MVNTRKVTETQVLGNPQTSYLPDPTETHPHTALSYHVALVPSVCGRAMASSSTDSLHASWGAGQMLFLTLLPSIDDSWSYYFCSVCLMVVLFILFIMHLFFGIL